MAAIHFPIEAGHIRFFARAIGDPNPVYRDPAYAHATNYGGIIPPPTFYFASAQYDPDWHLRPKIGEPWFGSGKTPTGNPDNQWARRGLHAEQHFEYHHPVYAGDELSATVKPGNNFEKQGRRGGKLLFSETITEYRNQNGERVVTARSIMVVTEKAPQTDTPTSEEA